MDQNKPSDGKQRRYSFKLALAAATGQVGCLTALISIGFLLIGIFIDRRLDTSPTFTVILLLISIPITILTMLWIVRNVTRKLKSGNDNAHNS